MTFENLWQSFRYLKDIILVDSIGRGDGHMSKVYVCMYVCMYTCIGPRGTSVCHKEVFYIQTHVHFFKVCVCVCVCVRERERERECVCVRACVYAYIILGPRGTAVRGKG
jgi:hypothetical protein